MWSAWSVSEQGKSSSSTLPSSSRHLPPDTAFQDRDREIVDGHRRRTASCCKHNKYSLNWFPSDLRHDGALPSQILIAEAEKVVYYKGCKDINHSKMTTNFKTGARTKSTGNRPNISSYCLCSTFLFKALQIFTAFTILSTHKTIWMGVWPRSQASSMTHAKRVTEPFKTVVSLCFIWHL